MNRLLGKPKETAEQKNRRWQRDLKKSCRGIDRDIRKIEREEAKVKAEIKKLAKSGRNKGAIKALAKSYVQSRRQVQNLHLTKTQINSCVYAMKSNAATIKMAGTMEKSADVMQSMSKLVNMPKVMGSMRTLAKEMERAGMIEEMTDDAFAVMEDPDLEEAADEEVDKVIQSLLAGQLSGGDNIKGRALPQKEQEVEEEEEEDLDEMKARLASLNA